MLESIKVTERLHWPELEMSKKCILSAAATDKPASPSQVYLDKLSPGLLKNLFTTGTSSYNVLLQAEEERQSPKHSPHRRPKTSTVHTSTFHKQNRPCALRGQERSRNASQPNSVFSGSFSGGAAPKPTRGITVQGSTMGLSARPVSRPRKVCATARTKLPSLPKSSIAREAENSKRLCILTAIKPSNVEKEKAKFFKSDFAYNPQFEYSNPVSPLVLARHSSASDRFLTQAVRIMELALQRYGNYETFEQATGGSLLTRSRIWSSVKKYMEKEGCVGEIVVHVTDDLLSRASMTVVNGRPKLTINISTAREYWLEGMLRHEIVVHVTDDLLSRASMTVVNGRPKLTINISTAREYWLEGMLRHEIGTHYFRGINNSHQPWSTSAGRRKHNLRPLNPTEEGLASIHSVLFRKDPTLWRAALLYYTVHQAARMSFSQLFHNLGRFVQDPSTRWDYCVRAKRGQTDTAQPGCFSKDQVYLDGILKILRHREKIDFPTLMALGKVSFEDVDRLKGLAQMENVRIPHFLQDQASYAEQLRKIMEVNQLTDKELRSLI